MAADDERAQKKVSQFRNLSKADERVLGRLVTDRTDPNRGKLKDIDLSAVGAVTRRTLRDATDIRNIFQVQPDLNIAREILVSAVVSPGDLSSTTLIFSSKIDGKETALTAQMVDVIENFFINEKNLDKKITGWIDDALVWSGAHPIMIIPEASIDRMINGAQSASMESVASFDGEWTNGWYRPKGIFGLALPTAKGIDYVSLESSQRRINTADMADYHTIKMMGGAKETKGKKISLPIKVTDNLAAFRMPMVMEAKRTKMRESVYGNPSMESRRRRRAQRDADAAQNDNGEGTGAGKKTAAQSPGAIHSQFFKPPQGMKRSRLEVVPTRKQVGGEAIGHPLEYHLAIEAVMPICVPGDPTNIVGYLVAQDQNGFPLSFSRRVDYYSDIRRGAMGGDQVGSSSQVSGELLNMANETLNGGISNASDALIDRLVQLHGEVVEHDIIARISSGLLGGEVEIARSEHIDKLMFARTMKNQQTILLYVPAELMIYMCFDVNEYGVGKSILDDAKALAAMRATLLVANIIGAVKNAIPGKDINITLDAKDGDPVGTVTFLSNEAMALSYHQFPTGIISVQGLAEQLQMSGYSVNVTGHPAYPEVSTTITPRESNYVPVDTDLLNSLRSDLHRVFSLTPEMVDGVNEPDFATTVVANHLMLLKRVMVLQNIANPQITDYVRVFTYNSGILLEQLMDIIDNNEKLIPDEYKEDPEAFLEAFLNSLVVNLPAPSTDNLTKQIELYDKYSEALDKIIPAYVTEEYFHGYTSDTVKEAIPTVIASLKGIELRRWMRERGFFRELDIFVNTEDGSPLLNLNEEMKQHVTAMIAGLGDYIKIVAEDAYKHRKDQERLKKLDQKVKDAIAELGAESEEAAPDFDAEAPVPDMGEPNAEEQPADDELSLDEEPAPEEEPLEEEKPEEELETPEEEKPTEEEPVEEEAPAEEPTEEKPASPEDEFKLDL